jgi:o-succinylbenzoate synthase
VLLCNMSLEQPQIDIVQAKVFVYTLPFQSAMQFKHVKLHRRKGLLLKLVDINGANYFSEIAPLPGFSDETFAQVKTEIIKILSDDISMLTKKKSHYKSVQFTLDTVFINSEERLKRQQPNIDNVPLLHGNCELIAEQYQQLDYPNLIKLKIARQSVDADIATFQMLCELNPLLKIRCDANQAWNKQQATQFFSAINTLQLDYIEEPTSNHQTNLNIADKYQVYLGLDESLQPSYFSYQHHHCIKAFIIKPTLIGNLKKIDQLVSLSIQHGLTINFSSSFESVIGLQTLKGLASHYLAQKNTQKPVISLGIDTLKYFNSALLMDEQKMEQDCQQLEVLWSSH